jgi:hypothetical protein
MAVDTKGDPGLVALQQDGNGSPLGGTENARHVLGGERRRGRAAHRMRDIDLDGLVIDNTAEGLFRVHRRVFTDPDMLELERQQVFEHS